MGIHFFRSSSPTPTFSITTPSVPSNSSTTSTKKPTRIPRLITTPPAERKPTTCADGGQYVWDEILDRYEQGLERQRICAIREDDDGNLIVRRWMALMRLCKVM